MAAVENINIYTTLEITSANMIKLWTHTEHEQAGKELYKTLSWLWWPMPVTPVLRGRGARGIRRH